MNTLPLLPHCYLAATSLLPHPLLLPSLLPLPRWYLTLYCYLAATSLLPHCYQRMQASSNARRTKSKADKPAHAASQL